MRRLIITLVVALGLAVPAYAQLATGNVYGMVADESGAALPGAAVTLKGSGATMSTTSGADGRYRFLNLPPGSYTVSVALTGFSTVNRENVIVNTGASVDIPVSLKVAQVEETITVTAESPVIDTKRIGTSTNFTQEELAKVPNSRDPWALLRTVPGMIMDRVNIAGNESGQQSAYRAKGAAGADSVWNLDGISITDMAAIGASPTYFDYDAFQEIQISTSGNDIKQPTGGVGLNFVTKRGTNAFHGTIRGYFTHDDMEAQNVPDELVNLAPIYRDPPLNTRPTTPETANHNKQVADYGFDLGGPIIKDKLWFWGSWGKQDIRLVRSAGALIDKTLLKDYNVKLNWQASSRDMVSLLWFQGAKEKFGRGTGAPGCNGCIEAETATWNQGASYPEGKPPGLWKIEDNHVFNPSFFMTAKYAYYGAGFQLAPRGGLDGQAGISQVLGRTFGTTRLSDNVRPQHTANLDFNLFRNATGGSHEFKFGAGYRWTEAKTQTLWPGDRVVAFENSSTNKRARVYRESIGINQTYYWSAYLGDTFTKDRLTLNLGVRYDNQTGKAVASTVQGNGAFPNLVPGISFDGYDAPFTWKDFSPRVGLSYALDESRRTLVRASFARYASQLDTGTVGFANPSGGTGFAEYPWNDANGDHFAQPNEVNTSGRPLSVGGGFNPDAPTAVVSANQIDADLKAPITNEGIFGIDRELFPNFGVSVTYTYRKFSRFITTPRIGMTGADYAPRTFTGSLADGTPYSVVGFIPNAAKVAAGGSGRIETNDADYGQTFSGVEFAAVKRLSNRWMARIAAGYNNHTQSYGSLPVSINAVSGNPSIFDSDPVRDGSQVAPISGGSGNGDVFINGKWSMNAYALVQLPWNLEAAANVFGKQGTPFPPFISQSLDADGTQRLLLTQDVDTQRFENLWNVDFRLAKNVKLGNASVVVTADLFNAFNTNTELNRQRNRGSRAYALLTDYLSPRILRVGMRLGF
jgi:hypothetical protein